MPGRPEQLLHQIRRLVSRPRLDPDNDAVLLQRFAEQHDQDAFAALVARHGSMVMAVCRRIVHDVQEAEDIAQAVFLMLARKAAALRRPERLAAWLHGVARNLALHSRRALERRRQRERHGASATVVHADPLDELSVREMLRIFDDELQRLPEDYRLPVILCCLEGRSQEEAARVLGWSPGSVRGRLLRGRKQLSGQLKRRGLELGTVLAAVEVAHGASLASIHTGWVVTVVRAARAFACGQAGTQIPLRAAALAAEGLRNLAWMKLQGAAMLMLLGVVLSGGMVAAWCIQAVKSVPLAADAAAVADTSADDKKSIATDLSVLIHGMVVNENDAPVANAEVAIASGPRGRTARTSTKGRFQLAVDKKSLSYLVLTARESDGDRLGIYIKGEEMIPATVRLTLRKPRTVAVDVTDGQGRPAAGVKVHAVALYWAIADQAADNAGHALLRVPADAPLQYIYACQPGVGLDYVIFRHKGEPASDPYALAPDHDQPVQLVLAGTQTVHVRVVDHEHKPLAGIPVYPWYFERPKKGVRGDLNVAGLDEFKTLTDKAGVATFQTIPADITGKVPFWARTDDYFQPEQPSFDPKTPGEVTLVLLPYQTVRGRVALADGQPAADAEVQAGCAGYVGNDFHSPPIRTKADGSFTLRVAPDSYCVFAASRGRLSSAAQTRLVRLGKPVEPIQLVLQPATRIHGTVTQGKERRPVVNGHLFLYQEAYYQDEKFPEKQRLPNPKDSRKAILPRLQTTARTDREGRFEILAGPGAYRMIGPANTSVPPFEITDQKEHEITLHADRPELIDLAGRVVLKSEPLRGVREAKVWGIATKNTSRGSYVRAVTDGDGKFRTTRVPATMFIQALSADHRLSGIVRLGPDDIDATIPIGPTASVHGRLVNRATGAPLANRHIDFGFRVQIEGGGFTPSFGGHSVTNARGDFILNGLTTGWKFELRLVVERDADGQARRWDKVGNVDSVTPQKAEVIDLGDIQVDSPD